MPPRPATIRLVLGTLVGVPLAMCVGLFLWGATLPVEHTASGTRSIALPRTEVWPLIAEPDQVAIWRPEIAAVVHLPSENGRPRWQEVGGDELIYELVELAPPERLVTEVVDNPFFGGTWTWELADEGDRTQITITEQGQVYSPFFRALMAATTTQTASLNAALDSLEAHAASR